MNEAELQIVLKSIYDTCQKIEILLDKLKEANEYFDLYDDIDYFQELYDNLFDLTTEIEMHYGLI